MAERGSPDPVGGRREPPGALRALVRLFPRRPREAYGGEMWEVVRYRYQKEGGSGPRRARLALETAVDLAWSAARVWTTTMGGGIVDGWKGWGLDARFVARTLRRSPGYALTAVAVLAGAVAVNATVFSFVRGTLLYEPPWEDPEGVMAVWGSNTVDGQLRDVISGPNFIDLAREARSLEALAAFHHDDTYLTGEEGQEVLPMLSTSVDFLRVLGVTPFLGRDFDEGDRTSSGPVVVLVSHAFWRDRLGADPSAVGSSVVLEGAPHTVLGVLPEGFEFVAPVAFHQPLRDDVLEADERYRIHYNVVGRLAQGATPEEATRELSGIFRRIAREHTGLEGWSVLVEPLRKASVSAVRPVIWTLAATVGLVLLIALVNLATLFRIRTVARADELAVRVALGAGWARIARVLSLESGTLALAGALLGLAVTPFLLDRVTSMVPVWIPIPDSAARVPALKALLDPAVAAVSVGAAVLGAVALTLPGFVRAARRGAAPRGGRVHAGIAGTRLLVMAELALATVLCLGAALTARSASNLLSAEVGMEDRGLLSLWVGDVWGLDAPGQVAYFREIVREVEEIPGVRSAAVIDYPDFLAEDDYARVYFLDRELQPVTSQREEWRRVSEGLFETTGMRMVEGRSFAPDDFEGTPRVAVVNEAFARKHYPGGGAVGAFLSTHEEHYRDLEVVGVVADLRSLGPAAAPPPMLYVPNQGAPRGTVGMYVRVEGQPMEYARAVRDAISSVDPSQPVADIVPVSELVGAWVAIPRATRTLLSGLAALSLLLSAVGVFGVVSYAVRSRRSELGVRMALGASPQRLKAGVVSAVVPQVVVGIGVGLAAGVVAARGARAVLFGVSPFDPLSVAGAVAAMAAAALLATYLPALRAARVDPVEAIRGE
ncbi:MAG: hypothetical protein AMXMBFR53_03410 [Gemmatimonadota bacterium]